MAKPKRKRKSTPKVTPCKCEYNLKIAKYFDEALEKCVDDDDSGMEYYTALVHSDTFGGMTETLMSDGVNPECVLSDAVRFGFEAGKRMAEVDNLEKMVGY